MKRSTDRLIFFVFLLFVLQVSYGQSRKELENQRMRIIKDIEKTSKELEKTKSAKVQNLVLLKTLENQMGSRKKLINNLQYEVKLNENVISTNENKIQSLIEKHEKLKSQYNKLLRSSYLKRISNSKWSYLLSSENLNKLIVRWRYMNQFEIFTKQKFNEIRNLTGQIKEKNEEILKARQETLAVIERTAKNVNALEIEQKEKDAIVKKLSKEEEKLNASLKKSERERENLNLAIEKIIVAELSKSKEKEKADISVIKKKEIDNSGFSKNKGALDWPVSSGKITGMFGTHAHPTIKNIEVSNNGIDFTLPSGGPVTCVFDGDVVGVTSIPGFNIMVIIRHGSYYTVYSKLDQASVSKGQKLKRGQKIGSVSEGENGVAELHFELWKDKVKLDPQRWFNH
ncbi:MAG: peptidoglycan DD-metalloendopeptidase family protein [Saprospiraceae bacterium]|jgi:septal ring factor EnvC (AmiA/AmiB activator)|nr:peptidoglycan DD-metalloendopeptidase family protein [Saprospiraceae bacterium]